MPAIYQRARPTRFDEVVGQDHVTSLLVAAIRRGVVGHAYLFSGPRGVGKTTSARLLAMAVNCGAAGEVRPCGDCEACRAVQEGSHPDVIELDAASNNSVDDVRELREHVRLAPLLGGRRVWILDEAHMLSRSAANALLKTLEEPPPGLLFVLATTEPEKLPATVLSRCQHFRFRRLSDHEIRGKLARLVRESAREADDDALDLLARAADGAMRDAESMLERLLASGEPLTRGAAESALGLPPRERLAALARSLADGDLADLLATAADLYADGFAPRTLAEQLGRTLRDALLARLQGQDAPHEIAGDEDALVRALHTLDDAHERFVRRGDLYALEVTLIRAAAAMRSQTTGSAAHDDLPGAVAAAPMPTASQAPAADGSSRSDAPAPRAAAPSGAIGGAETSSGFDPNARPSGAPKRERQAQRGLSWHALLGQAGPQLKAFLLPAQASVEGDRLLIHYDERHAFHFAQLQRREAALYELIDGAGGASLAVVVEGPGGTLRRGGAAPDRDAGAAVAPAPTHRALESATPKKA